MEKKKDEILYRFEHRWLRDYYFEDPEYFAKTLLEMPGFLFKVLDGMYREHHAVNPYRIDQFSVSVMVMSDGTRALKIELPNPEDSPLCRRVYAFLSKGTEDVGFFCIENNEYDPKEGPFLCRWMPNGIHLNYGTGNRTPEVEFLECLENYKTYDPDKICAALIPPGEKLMMIRRKSS